jgi:hypothetical protein
MSPQLSADERERLRGLADGISETHPSTASFLAHVLLRVIEAMDREDDYKAEQNEQR